MSTATGSQTGRRKNGMMRGHRQARDQASHSVETPDSAGSSWSRSTFALGIVGSLLLYLAFPPVGWFWLGWVAAVPWLLLVRQETLSGRRPYVTMWLVSLIFWLVMLQGIRLAHWLNHFGWFALSAYLAVYLPVFVAIAREAVHRRRVPLVVAGPVVWVGLELVRGYLFTGFSMGLLGHTQYEWPWVIQIADIGGAYAVSFVLMLTAAGLAQSAPIAGSSRRLWPLGLAASCILAVAVYGQHKLGQPEPSRTLNVALVQANFNTRFETDPERIQQTSAETFKRYLQLTAEIPSEANLDLVIWPESVFTGNLPEIRALEGAKLPPNTSRRDFERYAASFDERTEWFARTMGVTRPHPPSYLVGTDTREFTAAGESRFNTAMLLNASGNIAGRYYKMHPVMFGEYIPFARMIPWLYEVSPMAGGLTPGPHPVSFAVGDFRLAPSICFESAVPHLIRGQVRQLQEGGEAPDVLVNLTHDGWFWGSSILDLQLAGAVFRAVELRRPMLVAANAGLSAAIDDRGQVVAQADRGQDVALVTSIQVAPANSSIYLAAGDWLAGLCLAATAVTAMLGFVRSRRKPL